ncbi:cbb3-type cytochrome c oxidase subunit I [Fodinibius halophilus]|uniref:Cbb3-type cytochrome c oxidase subunit I n=1 Tax=Fodinibius halophilus TaxID=1736908 RepID=A0A6M1SZR3_9BACT|nr:cbb3-type cytochrome c oxidase subunit I [Fodinibius halophilus]NGP88756.1 cbb3-type cytochrome c oxidase subunit I [Fodinibius halophilus]
MPAISRWMIRISLLYLLVGMVSGAIMLVNKAYVIHPSVWALLPIHIEVVIFGWVIQLTLGTAYWMLPRFLEQPQRGNPQLAIGMVVALNLGILVIIADILLSVSWGLGLLGRILELSAVVLFVILHWDRIVSYRASTT